MTTNLVSKFKEFMIDLGIWEQFVNTYLTNQQSFGADVKTVDEYLLGSSPSEIFSLGVFSSDAILDSQVHSSGDVTEMENMFATCLANLGWKLLKPVRVVKYEEFTF